MLIIRLFRVGKKGQPTYKIVVTDKKNPPSAGRFVEEVGFYNPITKERKINKERVNYWISKGAQQSDTVYNFLVSEKIIEGKKRPKHKIVKKESDDKKPQANIEVKKESEKQPKVKEEPKEEEKSEEDTTKIENIEEKKESEEQVEELI